MDAISFLDKIEKLLGKKISVINYEPFIYKNDEKGYEILFQQRKEDLSLYCHIIYEDTMYYMNLGNYHDSLYQFQKAHSLGVMDDFIEKVDSLINDKPFDKRIIVTIDIEDDILKELCMMAHERDITLNQLINDCLKNFLDSKNV